MHQPARRSEQTITSSMPIWRAAILILALATLALACSLSSHGPSATILAGTNDTVSVPVIAGSEARVELGDGAALVIPAHSLESDSMAVIERSPTKTSSLPVLGEDVLPIGEYYAFSFEGSQPIGPVQVVLPFDAGSIPADSQPGFLTVAFLDGDAWSFVPVKDLGGYVALTAQSLGDPIVAWHFMGGDRVDLSYKTREPGTHESLTVCDPEISLSVLPEEPFTGMPLEIIGRVNPVDLTWFDIIFDQTAASNLDVTLTFNHLEPGSGRAVTVETDQYGRFQFTLDPASFEEFGLRQVNWVEAEARCDPWFGRVNVPSSGVAAFFLHPSGQTDPARATPTQEHEGTSTPSALSSATQVPESAPATSTLVQIPSVVGLPLHDAIDIIEQRGFLTTWTDGPSTYPLGYVFDQAPDAGERRDTRFTTVVLSRSTQLLPTPSPEPSSAPAPTRAPTIDVYEEISRGAAAAADTVYQLSGPIGSLTCNEVASLGWEETGMTYQGRGVTVLHEPWVFGVYRASVYSDEFSALCPGLSTHTAPTAEGEPPSDARQHSAAEVLRDGFYARYACVVDTYYRTEGVSQACDTTPPFEFSVDEGRMVFTWPAYQQTDDRGGLNYAGIDEDGYCAFFSLLDAPRDECGLYLWLPSAFSGYSLTDYSYESSDPSVRLSSPGYRVSLLTDDGINRVFQGVTTFEEDRYQESRGAFHSTGTRTLTYTYDSHTGLLTRLELHETVTACHYDDPGLHQLYCVEWASHDNIRVYALAASSIELER